jgi:hypothetical protein
MVSSTISFPKQQRGWFDVLDDWIKRDRFRLCWLVWTTSFSHCLSCSLVVGLLGQRLLRVGTLTGWQVPILRVLTFLLRQLCLLLLTLWVILLFYSGVLKSQGRFCQVVPTWRALALCCSPRCLCSDWIYASSV